jgi:hypothetical protein
MPLDMRSSADVVQMEGTTANPSISVTNNSLAWMGRVSILTTEALQNSSQPNPLDVNRFYDFNPGNGFSEQATGMLSVNWLSPEYQTDLEWDDQLAALSYGNVNLSGGFGLQLPQSDTAKPLQDPRDMAPDYTQNSVLGASQMRDDAHSASQPARPCFERRNSLSAHSTVGSTRSGRTQGRFYVDGDAARAPFKGLAHKRGSVISPGVMLDGTTDSTGSVSDARQQGDVDGIPWSDKDVVSDEACHTLRHHLQLLDSARTQDHAMNPAVVPSHHHIRMLSKIYFDRFHPLYPFLRKNASQFEGGTGWILLLAIISVGAKYLQPSQS